MQLLARRRDREHAEPARSDAAGFDLLVGRLANVANDEREAQRDARERMVAVEDDVVGIDLGDGVDRVFGQVGGRRPWRRTFELRAGGDDPVWEDVARLEEDEVGVVFAERVLGLEMQRRLVAGLVAGERFLDLLEQVLAAEEELDGLAQLVDLAALCVGETPSQADDARCSDFHRTIIAQWCMDADRELTLLGGLSASAFMRRHWQRRPLLVRNALPGALAGVDRARLFALAASEGVDSRLVVRSGRRWSLRRGPIAPTTLPARAKAWTLLVQGVDLHDDQAHRLLTRFRFVADARLDDVMCSWASDGGGVGPHVDSYDVFLLQTAGRRRWRVGRVRDARLRDDVPLRMLAEFVPSDEWLLEPGDMLYLPPGWGHDGVAVGECITTSIGFRAPAAAELAVALLERIADDVRDRADEASRVDARRYCDAGAAPVARPARIPDELAEFADAAIDRALADRALRGRALGEVLSEPKAGTWFERGKGRLGTRGLALDRGTRMLYDDRFVFINGEAIRAGGADATLMRRLADDRRLDAKSVAQASAAARALLAEWLRAGWCVQPGDRFDDDGESP